LAIFDYTRIELRHLTARLCNDLITGTVTSPASGTFVCAETDWEKPEDYFNHWIEVFDYSGTGVGTSGNPTDWSNITPDFTHTLTFKPAATLTAGDLVEMHERFTVNTYNDFINLAIEMVAKEALVDTVDETIELATDTWQYDLPTTFLYIHRIDMQDADGDYDTLKPIDPRYWRVVKTSTLTLEFIKGIWSPTDGRVIRIKGLASPSILDTDTEECPVNPSYVSYQAAALLHQSRIRAGDVDSEYHSQQMTLCQAMADKVRPTMRVSIGGGIPVVEA